MQLTGSDLEYFNIESSDIFKNEVFAKTKSFEYYERYSFWGQGNYGPLSTEKDYYMQENINKWRNWDSNENFGESFWEIFLIDYKRIWF